VVVEEVDLELAVEVLGAIRLLVMDQAHSEDLLCL
jgi:hypothetical protein|tara:strand:+ start:73 stop:177 length:105 start_codon:yes stop_codon:yes gene_type:complete